MNTLGVDAEQPLRSLAVNPSTTALLFQSCNILDSLEELIDDDFPVEAKRIARLLRVLSRRANERLQHFAAIHDALHSPAQLTQIRDIARLVHVLHSYLRYLQASDALRSPPGIQLSMSLLVAEHAPAALGCTPGDINVLVRPQWTYNLKYIDLLYQLDFDVDREIPFVLSMPQRNIHSLIASLWDDSKDGPAPKHVAVLSFASLDRDDVLLYPLLAHELGHFIDYGSLDTPERSDIVSQIERLLPSISDSSRVGITPDEHDDFIEMILVAIREIIADLIAVRIAGFSYFVAFAEFFKTVEAWPGPRVNPENGYPGFAVRMQLIWNELVDGDLPPKS